MANTIKNLISFNFQESEKSEKISSNDLTNCFLCFLLMFSDKYSRSRERKNNFVKTLMEFFQKFLLIFSKY